MGERRCQGSGRQALLRQDTAVNRTMLHTLRPDERTAETDDIVSGYGPQGGAILWHVSMYIDSPLGVPAVHNINLDPLGAAEVDMAAAGNCTCCMVDGAVRERMLDVRVSSVSGALVI